MPGLASTPSNENGGKLRMVDDFWDDEQWCVEVYAEREQDQVDRNPSVYHAWDDRLYRLSSIQAEFEAIPKNGPRLARKAFRILYPLLGKYGARTIINSAGDPSCLVKPIAHRRSDRELVPWLAKAMRQQSHHEKQEQIGGAVLLALRSCSTLGDAFRMVSNWEIDGDLYAGVPDGGWGSAFKVKQYFYAYKRECMARGFADIRRVDSILSRRKPPENPLTLSELPSLDK